MWTSFFYIVPPKGVSAGFNDRNKRVGQAWSNYSDDEQKIFTPPLFEPLICEVMGDHSGPLMPNAAPTSTTGEIEQIDSTDKLTPEEKEKYIPIFKELVNMKSIVRDFKHGRLCRHSGNGHLREKVGVEEINKVVEQVCAIF